MLPTKKIKTVSNTFSIILFVSCFSFVLYRGIQCIDKFLSSPESSNIKYDSSENHIFPVFTFCGFPERKGCPKGAFNEFELRKCAITLHDYKHGDWVNEKAEYEFCKDPEILFTKLVLERKDLNISPEMVVQTFQSQTQIVYDINNEEFLWTKVSFLPIIFKANKISKHPLFERSRIHFWDNVIL